MTAEESMGQPKPVASTESEYEENTSSEQDSMSYFSKLANEE